MSTPTPTDASPTTDHPEPLGAGAVAMTSAGARATKTTAEIVFAAMQVANQLNRRNRIDPRQITKKIADLFRAMRDILDKGRVNLKRFRENLEARRGASEAPKAPAAKEASDKEASTTAKKESESTAPKETSDAVEGEISKATTAAAALMSHLDIDAAAAVWSLASLESHKFARQLADLSEARMRELDPGLMADYDAAREKGAGRLAAMEKAMSAHPEAGEHFKAAMTKFDSELQQARENRLEGRLVNQIAGIQQGRINNDQEKLSFEQLRAHFDEDTVSKGSHSYPKEMLDKVISADYEPSAEVRQAAFDLREAAAEHDAEVASAVEAKASKPAPARASGRSTTTRVTKTTTDSRVKGTAKEPDSSRVRKTGPAGGPKTAVAVAAAGSPGGKPKPKRAAAAAPSTAKRPAPAKKSATTSRG
ncbi:hypothetical protein ABZ234_08000 [Nocardiopsis sp. NPDC006198]|uniref:hypothetical protein n=1 Tax=Nocardiopsis sp. NPDC006198 TaxID=3154472 RepID=UPI0033B48C23